MSHILSKTKPSLLIVLFKYFNVVILYTGALSKQHVLLRNIYRNYSMRKLKEIDYKKKKFFQF